MRNLILWSLLIVSTACSSVEKKIGSPQLVGKTLAATSYANIYFSSQPSADDYITLKKNGFVAVVNLRDPSEYDESKEKNYIEKVGMHYSNIPFPFSAKLDDTLINKVTSVIVRHREKGKVLVHCSEQNRVGIWAGGHFFKDHGYSKAQAIKISQRLGIWKPGALKKLQTYLNKK